MDKNTGMPLSGSPVTPDGSGSDLRVGVVKRPVDLALRHPSKRIVKLFAELVF